MKAVAHAKFTFQMLTSLKKYLYRQSQYKKTWDSKSLALIAQMVGAFGMNPKVGDSSPPLGRVVFCLKNFHTFTKTSVRVSKINGVAAHS